MGAVLALGALALAVVCVCVTGPPWQVGLFITSPLAGLAAYAACHLGDHRDPR